MTAAQFLTAAKALNVKGVLIKTFKNGQELRAYTIIFGGERLSENIRAFPGEHA